MKSFIPNSITALNLFCGCTAVLTFLSEEYILGVIFVVISLLADFIDGLSARLLNAQSELGKQLDSLADMISFGFVPGVILFKALIGPFNLNYNYISEAGNQYYLPFIGFLITIFSALRLAKFNIDSRQAKSFIGLPTPANTLFFLTIPLIWINETPGNWVYELTVNKPIIIGLTILFSFFLIGEFPLLALKFKRFRLKENIFRYLLLIISFIVFLALKHLSIPLIIMLYILISLIENKSKKIIK